VIGLIDIKYLDKVLGKRVVEIREINYVNEEGKIATKTVRVIKRLKPKIHIVSARKKLPYLALSVFLPSSTCKKVANYVMKLENFFELYADCYVLAYYDMNSVASNHIVLNCDNKMIVIGHIMNVRGVERVEDYPIVVRIFHPKEIKGNVKGFYNIKKLKELMGYVIDRVSKHLKYGEVTKRDVANEAKYDVAEFAYVFKDAKFKLIQDAIEYKKFLISLKPKYYVVKVYTTNPRTVYVREIDKHTFIRVCRASTIPFKPIKYMIEYLDKLELIQDVNDNFEDSI
jgi:hypothetical protein